MKMNTKVLMGVALLAAAGTQASIYTYSSGTLNAVIPDANPLGYATVGNITVNSPDIDQIRDVNVSLNISGGFNGDLYGYLVSPDSTLVVLLNRIGTSGSDPFGNDGSIINVTLDDGASTDIHNAAFGNVTGSYKPDGSSLSSYGTYASPGGPATGNWTLFLADLSGGDQAQLVSWSLTVDVVPEPTTWAAIIFGSLFAGFQTVRFVRSQKLKTEN